MKNLSIIVPIYNKGNVLETSLVSLCRSLPKKTEILLIDDFSSDQSASIAKRLAKEDERIRSLSHSRNLGVSSTRNLGMREAKGEYIGFFDADDTVSSSFYEQLLDTAFSRMRHPDVVVGDFVLVKGEERSSDSQTLFSSVLPIGFQRKKYLKQETRSCCNKIYRRSFLEGKYFPAFFFLFHCWVAKEVHSLMENREAKYFYHLENREQSLLGQSYPFDFCSSFLDGSSWLSQKFGTQSSLAKTMHSLQREMWISELYSVFNWNISHQEKCRLIGSVLQYCSIKDPSFSIPRSLASYYDVSFSYDGSSEVENLRLLENKVKMLTSKYPKRNF